MSIIRRNPPFGLSATEDKHLVIKAPEATIAGTDIEEGECALALNSATNKLVIRAKYPGGELMCATLSLSSA